MSKQLVNDNILVEQYLQGNESAFSELIYRHKEKIFSFIRSYISNSHTANDIFQETFFKVIEALKKGEYKETQKFLNWVLCITHHEIINSFRDIKRGVVIQTTELNPDGQEVDILNTLIILEECHENYIVKKQFRKRVRKLIRHLAIEQQQVIILRFFFGLNFKEIARQYDISKNTALGRLHYGLKNLNKIIANQELNFYDDRALSLTNFEKREIYFDCDTIKV